MLGGTWFFRASGVDGKKQAGARAAAAGISCLVRHVYASKRAANVEAEAFGRSGGFRCALVWFWPRWYFRSELASLLLVLQVLSITTSGILYLPHSEQRKRFEM